MKMIKTLLLILLFGSQIGYSQNIVLKNMHKGNLFYLNGAYKDAVYSYEKVLQESPFNFKANFNLGNAYFKMEEYDKAIDILEPISERGKTDADKSMVYHNIGNCYMMKGEFEEAIEAYKKGLRLNPRDEATRYNLAYALLKQQEKEQQQQQNDQNQDQQNEDDQNSEDQKDQNGDGQKDDQNNDQKEKGDKNENDSDGKEDQKNDEQNGEGDKDKPDEKETDNKPKPNKLSKEQAKRLLEAAAKKEKEIQEKKDKNLKVGTAKPQAKKDW